MSGRDPYKYFRIEARELLGELDRGLLALEKGEGDTALCQKLLRFAHTLKGAARVVKQPSIADMAHAFEEAIAPYREQPLQVPQELLRTLAAQVRQAGVSVESLGRSATDVALGGASAQSASMGADDRFETIRIGIGEFDKLLEGLSVVGRQLASLRRETEWLRQANRTVSIATEQLNACVVSDAGFAPPVLITRIARARGLLDESKALLERSLRGLATNLDQSEAEVRALAADANSLRLIPAGSVFGVLERVVRDVGQQLNREVEFVTAGGEHRLDAHVLGPLSEALQHLVRNAVDHGIEPAATRQAAGKRTCGQVAVRVERRGNRLAFICRDDGGGIDLAAIRRAACERGRLTEEEASALDASAVLQLLLTGGLSSRREVTQISGRGIGLDVVRETAERLNGRIAIVSEQDQYTEIEVSVPPILSSQWVLLVEVDGATVCLPLEHIRETRRIAIDEIVCTPNGGQILDGHDAEPYCELAVLLRDDAVASSQHGYRTLILLESHHGRAAVGVDRLLGSAEVVVRPLPAMLTPMPLVMGATFDTEGNPQLLLDPAAVVRAVCAGIARPVLRPPPVQRPRVLVVDDSLTTRMLEQNILETAGYRVDLAVSGEDGLSKVRQQRYALFVVDVEMPGIDGFEFIRQVRLETSLRDIPAVLVTSLATEESRRRGLEVGAEAYIVKGEFEQGAFMETVRQLTT